MHIRWHGHSCFELSDDDTTVVIDPHDGKSIGIRPPRATADVVLVTHPHYDHNAVRVIDGDHKDHVAREGRFECRNIAFHGYPSFHDDRNGTLRGMNTIYTFELDGMKVGHCGDLGAIPSPKVMKALQGLDILFVPVGEKYTMDVAQVKEFVSEVNPLITVPMHYRIGGLSLPISSIDKFLDEVPQEFVKYVGNSIDFSRDDLPDCKECWVFDRQ